MVTQKLQKLNETLFGRACGIDEQGALLLQTGDGKHRYCYGEARVRV